MEVTHKNFKLDFAEDVGVWLQKVVQWSEIRDEYISSHCVGEENFAFTKCIVA